MVDFRPRSVALGTALLGVVSLLTAVVLLTTIPEKPPGNGFAAGLTGIFVLLYAVVGLLALVEAGVLGLVTRLWVPAEWPRRLLMGGAAAGGLAVVLLVGPLLVSRLAATLLGRLVPVGNALEIGLVLVPVGIGSTALGLALHLVEHVRTRART